MLSDQVRTRVFNMIAEYRRILKNPTPERKKKCIFFDALHKIYQAKDANGVRLALNNYEEDFHHDPIDYSNQFDVTTMNGCDDDDAGDGNSGTDNEEKEIFSYSMSPSHALHPTMMMNAGGGVGGLAYINGHDSGHEDSQDGDESDAILMQNGGLGVAGPPHPKRIRLAGGMSAAAANRLMNGVDRSSNSMAGDADVHHAASQQANSLIAANAAYAHLASLDPTSSALLIDRMFAHLSKETEVMREWVTLERERLEREAVRRREETERDERREQAFLSTLMKMQEQMLNFLKGQNFTSTSSSSTAAASTSPTVTSECETNGAQSKSSETTTTTSASG